MMKILCLNVRGIGGGGKVRKISKMIEEVGFVGVIETKKKKKTMD